MIGECLDVCVCVGPVRVQGVRLLTSGVVNTGPTTCSESIQYLGIILLTHSHGVECMNMSYFIYFLACLSCRRPTPLWP